MADTSHFGRLAGTAIVVLGVAGAFLYLGGWFNSEALTPGRFADGFERADGIYSGFRLNHAKGVCVSGSFESNGRGTRLSKAVVFKAGRVPTIGRFSFAGGNPYVADGPESVRGFGLLFKLPDGEEWRTAMINTAVFGVHTPQAFYDRLFASQPDPKKASRIRRKWRDFVAPGISSKETHYRGDNSYETDMARPFRISHRGRRGQDFDRSVSVR